MCCVGRTSSRCEGSADPQVGEPAGATCGVEHLGVVIEAEGRGGVFLQIVLEIPNHHRGGGEQRWVGTRSLDERQQAADQLISEMVVEMVAPPQPFSVGRNAGCELVRGERGLRNEALDRRAGIGEQPIPPVGGRCCGGGGVVRRRAGVQRRLRGGPGLM